MPDAKLIYSLAADTLLVIHVSFVAFVVLGLLLVYVGKWLSWGWIRNPWFRMLHLLGIGIVVAQAWVGVICPLTTWEMALRAKSGGGVYEESFIAHWLQALLYYQAPFWVFAVIYTVFGGLILVSWFVVKPRPFGGSNEDDVA